MSRAMCISGGRRALVWRGVAMVSMASAGLWGAPAAAQGTGAAPERGRVELRYQLGKGAAGCEDEATFRAWVAGKLEGDPFARTGPAPHRLDVQITREWPGFRGVVELHDEGGRVVLSRRFLERTCQGVVDRTVAVVILSVFPPPPLPAPPPPSAPPAPDCEPCAAAERRDREKMRRELDTLAAELAAQRRELEELRKKKDAMDLTFWLSGGALITANLTSNVGPGVWLGGEARSGPLSLGLELRGVLPASVTLGPKNDFDASQFIAFLIPCGRYSYFFGCGVAGAGAQFVYDSNYVSRLPLGTSAMVQLGGRIGLEIPLGDTRFAARAWGEVLYSYPTVFVNYTTDGLRWDQPDVSAFFGLGLVVKLGKENEGVK